ncbi:MAG: chromosome segregation protein SMC [Verrucomicrobia bacterium]|nr:chromosome segregation protein SMC [Verrucomicrobiota bacterium]MDA1086707.1 chromosome segregation protein SMC [Verrucomicrobiota bacterium]
MYLKSIELNGFKSFANKTTLGFRPGMMAIVGPNGCGKSNVCEAIRWVLGEKSAKALRGKKMEDVIFNGADGRRPLGMAEVSITFGDCESTLETEFNEVTVSRRVFRSGDNQYLINKKLCRLKDIQRLFMDTGIGTVSYSMLEQGHIDRILSSRPEDRRSIFEEASGINKFKNDRIEAIRKLDHTEANLLRLDDVIREVKRQIGSLQRQAGKARRYKTLQDELRALDLFLTRETLEKMHEGIGTLEKQSAELASKQASQQSDVTQMETSIHERQAVLNQADQEIAAAIESAAETKGELQNHRHTIATNEERIAEYRAMVKRGWEEVARSRTSIESLEASATELESQVIDLDAQKTEAQEHLTLQSDALAEHQRVINAGRDERQDLRAKMLDLEGEMSRLQNERVKLESEDGLATIRSERLAAEQGQLSRLVEEYVEREHEAAGSVEALKMEVGILQGRRGESNGHRAAIDEQLNAVEQVLRGLQSQMTAGRAQLEILGDNREREDLPKGNRLAMQDADTLGSDTGAVLGTLADLLSVPGKYQLALEASLRSWLDAVVLQDQTHARDLLNKIAAGDHGSTRILSGKTGQAGSTPDLPQGMSGERLSEQVTCDPSVRGVVTALLGQVLVVDSLAAAPATIPEDWAVATLDGSVLRGTYAYEHWCPADEQDNPVSRKHQAERLTSELSEIEKKLSDGESEHARITSEKDVIARERSVLDAEADAHQLSLATTEGEHRLLSKETAQVRQRLETVRYELKEIADKGSQGRDARESLAKRHEKAEDAIRSVRDRVEQLNKELHKLESEQSALYNTMTDRKVRYTEVDQRLSHTASQRESVDARLRELRTDIEGEQQALESYDANISSLSEQTDTARNRIPELSEALESRNRLLEETRKKREDAASELRGMEDHLSGLRSTLDAVRETRSDVAVKLAEARMRRENLVERVCSDYGVVVEDISQHPEPEWDHSRPSPEALETRVAELRTKMEAIGPVNLVAIEEYQELEERFEFLTKQRDDLVNAKQQLIDMIKKINQTTSELFTSTFVRVNENFQAVFSKLFGGGIAKLVLTNEEDVLECGVEIIARPPGKQLQNISLLSGGERTMTAVALLFSIYMIKPSPFCVLDELDAALDDSNIGRFIDILSGFLDQSQFIIVTHNRKTVAAADVLFGVTMVKNTGVSKIVSIKFNDTPERQPEKIQAAPPRLAEAEDAAPDPAETNDEAPRPEAALADTTSE